MLFVSFYTRGVPKMATEESHVFIADVVSNRRVTFPAKVIKVLSLSERDPVKNIIIAIKQRNKR